SDTLSSFATSVVSAQTGASSTATTDLATATAVQKTLTTKTAAVSGVSVDDEMSTMISLQNSYAANARMITAINSMWTQALNMVSS
ncbi:flagellar basal body rod C-terminal domain-containing protein, partial [Telmatospirillum sp.]|uniref:flagellar basal body rod C-terminal domain-containing protein n=1 Tax=Telmatospirillum sp. TaxID=2079197 RepID=UPI00284B2D85